METVYIDVMVGTHFDKFYAQVKAKRCAAFKLTPEEMAEIALEKLPALKYQKAFLVVQTDKVL